MSDVEIITNYINKYSKNQLIFASELYKNKINGLVSETSYYKTLERMVNASKLLKVSKGIYYIPENSRFGLVPISSDEIVDSFTKNKKGMVVGYYLYNKLNLTTQIAKNVDIYSSKIKSLKKEIRNVKLVKVDLSFNEKVIRQIELLEVLQNFGYIEELNFYCFIKFIEEYVKYFEEKTTNLILEKIRYKKSTIAFLNYILNYYKIDNSLGKYLSSLSKYNYPSMEKLYEFARKQKGIY